MRETVKLEDLAVTNSDSPVRSKVKKRQQTIVMEGEKKNK